MRALGFCSTLAVALSVAAEADAACPAPERDWVELAILGPALSAQKQRIFQHLGVELARDGVELCAPNPTALRPPLARFRIEFYSHSHTGVALSVDGQKRQLDLSSLPSDTHALAVALGAVELLRVSRERDLERQPPEPATPPSLSRTVLQAGLGGEAFVGGLHQVGLDSSLVLGLVPRLAGMLRVGKRFKNRVTSPHGALWVDTTFFGVGARANIFRAHPRVHLEFDGSLNVMWLNLRAEAKKDYLGSSVTGHTEWASLALITNLTLTPRLSLFTAMEAGWVLLPLSLTDTDSELLGIRQLMAGARIGMGVSL